MDLNLLIAAVSCLVLGLFIPEKLHFGPVIFKSKSMFFCTGLLCLVQVLLFFNYVKRGRFRHRDFILREHARRGDERVLDVGCGRGLLLVGAAHRALRGHGTGLDIWSKEDLSSNSEAATLHNLVLDGVQQRCLLVSWPAQEMPFADASFDVVVSNVYLHNIYDRPTASGRSRRSHVFCGREDRRCFRTTS